jgi:ElaB/YqjD/DUF883 family membrane-anchored ribosome-binding protein
MNESDVKQGRINDQLGTQLESLSAQVEANLERGRNSLSEWKTAITDKSRQAYKAANDFTQNRPWQAIGAALLLGYIAGRICARD